MQRRIVNRLNTSIAGAVAAIALTVTAPLAANANETRHDSPPVALSSQQLADVEAIELASDPTALTFDAAVAERLGGSAQSVSDAAIIFAASGWAIHGTPTSTASTTVSEIANTLALCAGKSGYNGFYFPWGHQLALNACQTSQINAAAFLGAAGAGIVAAILIASGAGAIAAPIAGLVAAVLGFGGAALQVCSSASAPTYAIYINLGGSPVASCWGQ